MWPTIFHMEETIKISLPKQCIINLHQYYYVCLMPLRFVLFCFFFSGSRDPIKTIGWRCNCGSALSNRQVWRTAMSLQNELQRAAQVFRDPAQFYRNILNASGVFNLSLLILCTFNYVIGVTFLNMKYYTLYLCV